jgi:hypothetical protein
VDGADRPSRFDPDPPGKSARRLTVIAQDPSVAPDGKVLRDVVTIPADRLEPGPRGPRFWVVDYDSTARKLVAPAPQPWTDAISTDACPDELLAVDPKDRKSVV